MSEPNRQAIDTIRGYLYQFDHTIFQILNHHDENSIFTIEGVEDIDIELLHDETVTIQCKYYEKTDFTPAVIKEATIWMIKDFYQRIQQQKELIQYKLFGHFKSGGNKIPKTISVEYLKKNLLTKTTRATEKSPSVEVRVYEQLDLNDEQLKIFISKLTFETNGLSLDDQYIEIINKFIDLNICQEKDVDFYYAKSLSIIRNLAKEQLELHRKISKKNFIKKLKDSKKMILDYWFLEKIGEEKYSKSIRKKYFNNTQSKFNRFFLIDTSNFEFYDVKNLLISISNKWSNQPGKRQVEKFCPYVYLHNFDYKDLCKIKEELVSEDFLIEDGHYYKDSNFNSKLFIRDVLEHANPYRVSLKIINNLADFNKLNQEKIPNKYIYQMHSKADFLHSEESIDIYFSNLSCLRRMICD